MVPKLRRIVVGTIAVIVVVMAAFPAYAVQRELATAVGTILISAPPSGLRAPRCNELVVEARDALDDHLIGEAHPTTDEAGECRYALTVPAQTAVWLRVLPVLVAGTRAINGKKANYDDSAHRRSPNGSVALRFTLIASGTYFFAPDETKLVALKY